MISNCDAFNAGKVAESIMRAALGLTEFVALDLPVPAAEAARFVGEYAAEEVPFEIKIVERAGQVFAQSPGQRETRLLYQDKGDKQRAIEFYDQAIKAFPEYAEARDGLKRLRGA